MEKIKIVVDSSADMLTLQGADFSSAPLKIVTSVKEYVDNDRLDVFEMVNDLKSYKGKSSTSCPNVNDWLVAFGDAERIICITITGTLSGSFNSASLAAKQYMESKPEANVFVINSLSAGPEMKLIAEKICDFASSGLSYEEICEKIMEYKENTGLLFMLESMRNLANNGRVNPIVAGIAGLLGIRVVGKASDKGDLEQLDKCRGEAKALSAILKHLKALGYKGGKVRIGNSFNEVAANRLSDLIKAEYPSANIEIYQSRGICSFYAEKGGLMIGFEKI